MEDFKEEQIQDIASVLASEFSHEELKDIRRRFQADHLKTEDAVPDDQYINLEDRVKNWLRKANGTETGRQMLAYMVENTLLRKDQIEELEDALKGSRFVLNRDNGNLQLMLRISATAETEIETHRSYVEEHASDRILQQINKAERNLAKGDTEGALSEARKALEKMTVGNYHSGLDELVSEGLISTGAGNTREDKEMLYLPYGYCSSLGSHTGAQAGTATDLQAETGLILMEEAIHFLLRIIQEAKDQDIDLEKWDISSD
jgi:hypothetical protein